MVHFSGPYSCPLFYSCPRLSFLRVGSRRLAAPRDSLTRVKGTRSCPQAFFEN